MHHLKIVLLWSKFDALKSKGLQIIVPPLFVHHLSNPIMNRWEDKSFLKRNKESFSCGNAQPF